MCVPQTVWITSAALLGCEHVRKLAYLGSIGDTWLFGWQELMEPCKPILVLSNCINELLTHLWIDWCDPEGKVSRSTINQSIMYYMSDSCLGKVCQFICKHRNGDGFKFVCRDPVNMKGTIFINRSPHDNVLQEAPPLPTLPRWINR